VTNLLSTSVSAEALVSDVTRSRGRRYAPIFPSVTGSKGFMALYASRKVENPAKYDAG
jgi:hypothetical protein